MRIAKAALHSIVWVIAIIFQILVGFVAGYIFFAEGYGDLVFMWIGITLGVFVIGVLATVFRKAFHPKNYLVRLGFSGLFASLPLAIFYHTDLFFYNADYETPPEFPLAAVLMGVLGFYVLRWLNRGSYFARGTRITGYGMSLVVIATGCLCLWNWMTPFPLPFQESEFQPVLNMELVNIVGEGFHAETIRGNTLYGISDHRLAVFDIADLAHITPVGQSEIIPGDLVRINLFENYAYITAGKFGYEKGNKIHIVDIAEPSRPHYLASYDLPGEYIWSVDTFQHYLYIVGCIKCGQEAYDQHALYIMDLSNPQTPMQVGQYDSDINIGDMAFYGNYAYLALAEAEKDHDGLRILDVTDPKAPQVVASLLPSTKGGYVAISNQTLYFDGQAPDLENGLYILDLSNPAMPREVAFHSHSLYGQFGMLSDDIVYSTNDIPCGCAGSEGPPNTVVTLTDYSNPQQPRQRGTFTFAGYFPNMEGHIAIAWDSVSQAYKFFDLSNPDELREVGRYVSISLHDLNGELYVDGTRGVVGTNETDLYVLDLSNPSFPVVSTIYDVGDTYWLIGLYDTYVYVHLEEEIQVLDISDPAAPVIVWRYDGVDTEGSYTDMKLKGNHAYLSNSLEGLYVYDISDSRKPVLVNVQKELAGYDHIDGFDTDGTHFYIFGEDDIRIFNASDPENIVETGKLDQSFHQKVTILGHFAFLDDSSYSGREPATLSILDLTDPAHPDLVNSYRWLQWSTISGSSANMTYIADGFYGLTMMDFSDPKNPKELAFYDMEDGAIGAAAGEDNLIYVLSDSTYALYVLRYIPPSP